MCAAFVLNHNASRIQLNLSSANISLHLHDFSQQNKDHIAPTFLCTCAGELVSDQMFFIAAKRNTSWRKNDCINDIRKSCHRKGRAVLIRSFFHMNFRKRKDDYMGAPIIFLPNVVIHPPLTWFALFTANKEGIHGNG